MSTVLIFLVVLGFLIIIHELGHFITAKAFGIKVLEFGLGFPPRLLRFRRGETTYSLNLLPLGGFVKLLGEEDPSDPRSLASRSLLTRFIVISAGSLMNILLPIVLFTVVFMIPQDTLIGMVQIKEVNSGSPAEEAGLQVKDIILKVDGHEIRNTADLAYRLQLRLGAETNWIIKRGSDEMNIQVVPRWRPPVNEGQTGIGVSMILLHGENVSYPLTQALPKAVQRIGETLVLVKNEIIKWIIGAAKPVMAGPIGIAQVTGEIARVGGVIRLLEFSALLSINLAILNVLPIPMLDGGRLLFVFIEWVRRGKRIPPEKESFVHLVGLVLLLSLVVIISYFDIIRIFRGDSLLR